MFRDCARLERNVFVTWKEDDVNEQDVEKEKECWERKRMLRKKKSVEFYLSFIWVRSWLDRWLALIITHTEYSLVCTANWLEFQSCSVLSILIRS